MQFTQRFQVPYKPVCPIYRRDEVKAFAVGEFETLSPLKNNRSLHVRTWTTSALNQPELSVPLRRRASSMTAWRARWPLSFASADESAMIAIGSIQLGCS